MEKEMLVVAKFKEGEGKFEKFMGFMQSPEGLAERKKVAIVEKTMASVEVKSFNNPDEANSNFNNAQIDIVKVGDQRVMRLKLQPGWKWSKDIKPTVGTDSCKAKHIGVIVSGAVCAKHDDGTELTYKAGDAYSIEPGHDGWVVGDEPVEVYEFHGKWGE